jgi:hypothetical protein
LSEYYDEVAIKGLGLAEVDVHRGLLDHERRVRIKDTILEVIDDLAEHGRDATIVGDLEKNPTHVVPAPTAAPNGPTIGATICMAGRGSLDEAAAALLRQLLQQHGHVAQIARADQVSHTKMGELNLRDVKTICLSYLNAESLSHARYLVRRLRRKAPNVKIAVGFWAMSVETAIFNNAVRETGADFVVTTLQHACEILGTESVVSTVTDHNVTSFPPTHKGAHSSK